MEIKQIDIKQIVEDNDQPRKHHSEESLQGLADSIRQHGCSTRSPSPPLRDGNKFKIVTGERRWRAANMARLDTVPCVVKDRKSTPRAHHRATHREPAARRFAAAGKGRAIQHVKSTLNLTNRENPRRLGLSERTVGYCSTCWPCRKTSASRVSSPNRPSDGQVDRKTRPLFEAAERGAGTANGRRGSNS